MSENNQVQEANGEMTLELEISRGLLRLNRYTEQNFQLFLHRIRQRGWSVKLSLARRVFDESDGDMTMAEDSIRELFPTAMWVTRERSGNRIPRVHYPAGMIFADVPPELPAMPVLEPPELPAMPVLEAPIPPPLHLAAMWVTRQRSGNRIPRVHYPAHMIFADVAPLHLAAMWVTRQRSGNRIPRVHYPAHMIFADVPPELPAMPVALQAPIPAPLHLAAMWVTRQRSGNRIPRAHYPPHMIFADVPPELPAMPVALQAPIPAPLHLANPGGRPYDWSWNIPQTLYFFELIVDMMYVRGGRVEIPFTAIADLLWEQGYRHDDDFTKYGLQYKYRTISGKVVTQLRTMEVDEVPPDVEQYIRAFGRVVRWHKRHGSIDVHIPWNRVGYA